SRRPGGRRMILRPDRRAPVAIAWLVTLVVAVACTAPGTTSQPTSGTESPVSSGAPSGAASTGCPNSQPEALGAGQTRTVTIETAKGTITMSLKADLSPIAVANFVALAECGYYNGVVFHR